MVGEVAGHELVKVWEEHTRREFVEKDVEATLATMTEDASVWIIPINAGGRGKEGVRAFYRDVLTPSVPDDMQVVLLNRVVGERHVVDEIRFTFIHNKQMDWILPKVPATNRRIELDHVVVVEFRGDKIAAERVYWDQATVLRQAGLMK